MPATPGRLERGGISQPREGSSAAGVLSYNQLPRSRQGDVDPALKIIYVQVMTLDLKAAVKKAGGYTVVALKIGATKQMIWSWVNVLKRIPAEHVMAMEQAINVPRHMIRPDIYPKEREAL